MSVIENFDNLMEMIELGPLNYSGEKAAEQLAIDRTLYCA